MVVSDDRPIGVFDSGVGGLTVVRSIIDALPHESVLYFGDTARYPYGPRSVEEIRRFAVQIAQHLVANDVKMIVVACNSATAAALDAVEEAVDVPVLGVIEPALRAAAAATSNRRVGLIGTEVTVHSGAYRRALERMHPEISLFEQACPLFVEFVERGDTTSQEVLDTAAGYLAPLRVEAVDTLVLGCTHYPLLRGAIQHVMGPDVLLVSSAEETASDVYDVLASKGLLRDSDRPPVHSFQSSGDPDLFTMLGQRFLGPEVLRAHHVSVEPASRG